MGRKRKNSMMTQVEQMYRTLFTERATQDYSDERWARELGKSVAQVERYVRKLKQLEWVAAETRRWLGTGWVNQRRLEPLPRVDTKEVVRRATDILLAQGTFDRGLSAYDEIIPFFAEKHLAEGVQGEDLIIAVTKDVAAWYSDGYYGRHDPTWQVRFPGAGRVSGAEPPR